MKKKIAILTLIYLVWGVLSRTVFHLGANVEFVTAIAIACGLLIKNKKIALIIPVIIMFLSDLIIGNSNIFIFTWSGFLIPVLFGFLVSKFTKKESNHKFVKLLGLTELAGITASVSFFIWTNFGHWITTNMYTKDFSGLIDCYINAIPFLKPQLAGNLIIVPILVLTSYYVLRLSLNKTQKLAEGKI